MPRRGVGALAVLSAATLGACGSSATDSRVAPRPEPSRDCSTHVEGRLPPHWRSDSVVAGPVALYPARLLRRESNPNPGARFVDEKTLVVVRAKQEGTLAVPQAYRRRASLDYERDVARQRRSGPVKLADGVSSVRFVACRPDARPLSPGHRLDRETQFNGGIVTKWGHCLPLDVFVRGRAAPLRAVISFGAGRCRATRG